MAEKKKGQKADFAKDKGAFHEGGSAKGAGTSQRGQQKKSGTHQPRDADRTSGQNVQRSEQTETFGQNVQKSAQKPDSRSHKSRQKSSIRNRTPLDRVRKGLRTQIQAVRRKLIFHRKTAPLRRKMAKSRRKGSRKMITAAGTPTANRKKREDTAGGSIRTGSEPRTLILSVTFRRRTQPLQREPIQSFMAARS